MFVEMDIHKMIENVLIALQSYAAIALRVRQKKKRVLCVICIISSVKFVLFERPSYH